MNILIIDYTNTGIKSTFSERKITFSFSLPSATPNYRQMYQLFVSRIDVLTFNALCTNDRWLIYSKMAALLTIVYESASLEARFQ